MEPGWGDVPSENSQVTQQQKDVVLLFLYCPDVVLVDGFNYDANIIGRTKFQKQLFLLYEESDFFNDNEEDFFDFFPSRYGPFSSIIDDCFTDLKSEGLIQVERITPDGPFVYGLTASGFRYIKSLWIKKSKDKRIEMFNIKSEFNYWALRDILYYVYDNYNEYTC